MKYRLYLIMAVLPGMPAIAAAQLTPFREHNRVGYRDSAGTSIVFPRYDAGSPMQEGFAVVMQGDKRGYLNARGVEAISCRFEDASLFSGGLACVQQGGRYGFIDPAGAWVIPPVYEQAFSFAGGLARVFRKGMWGMIDRSGTVVIPMIYKRLYDPAGGLIAASPDGFSWGYLDTAGSVQIDFRFRMALPFDPETGKGIVRTERGDYYISRQGRLQGRVKGAIEEEEARERREGIRERD